MELSEKQIKLAIGVLVLVVIGLGYLVWTRSATPEPTALPNQSLLAPMGASKAGAGPGGDPYGAVPPAARARFGMAPAGAAPGSR
jgi:hypothetical protein